MTHRSVPKRLNGSIGYDIRRLNITFWIFFFVSYVNINISISLTNIISQSPVSINWAVLKNVIQMFWFLSKSIK